MNLAPAVRRMDQKVRRKKSDASPMNGYNLFFKALKKKGVVNIREISSRWWSLTRQQRDALNERAGVLGNDVASQKQLCDDNIERYICQYCGCKFLKKVHIRQHLGECKIANPEKSMCKFCRKTYASTFSLKRHSNRCQWAKRGLVKELENIFNPVKEIKQSGVNDHLIEIVETMSTKAYMCLKCKVVRFEYVEISDHVENCIGKSEALNCAMCIKNQLSRSARIQHLIKDHSDFSLVENVENQECEIPCCELETIFSSGNFLRDTSLDFDSLIAMDDQSGNVPGMGHATSTLGSFSTNVNKSSSRSFASSSESISQDLKSIISMCKRTSTTMETRQCKNKISSSLLRVKPSQAQQHTFKCNFCEFARRNFATRKELHQHYKESHNFDTTPHSSSHSKYLNSPKNKRDETKGVESSRNIATNSFQCGFGVSSFSVARDDVEDDDYDDGDMISSAETMQELFKGESDLDTLTSQGIFNIDSADELVDEAEPSFDNQGLEDVVNSLQSISCPVCQGVFATGKLLDKHVREVHLIEL